MMDDSAVAFLTLIQAKDAFHRLISELEEGDEAVLVIQKPNEFIISCGGMTCAHASWHLQRANYRIVHRDCEEVGDEE